MLKALGQMVYTSFPGMGFRHLASAQVPEDIQDVFINQIVFKHWNSYQPNLTCKTAAYLHQPTPESCVFGWLYCDEVDEYGRYIPYFLGYYLAEPLNDETLLQILNCLQKGPLLFWDRHAPITQPLRTINLDHTHGYQSARQGCQLPSDAYRKSCESLNQNERLDCLFFSEEQPLNPVQESSSSSLDNVTQLTPNALTLEHDQLSILNHTDAISDTLQTLIENSLGIQSAFLVSSEGQPLTPPVGMDADSAMIMSGTMLYLAHRTNEELQWQDINKICIQGKEGYIILAQCTAEAFLLIQASKTLMGLLDGEINRTVHQLQQILNHGTNVTVLQPHVDIGRSQPKRYPEAVA